MSQPYIPEQDKPLFWSVCCFPGSGGCDRQRTDESSGFFVRRSMNDYSTCRRKRIYASEISVRRTAKRTGMFCSHKIYFYHCLICGGWHLTKKERRNLTSIDGFSKKTLREIRDIICTSSDDRKEIIGRKSRTRTIFKVRHPLGTFKVLYSKVSKKVAILKKYHL